MTSSEKDISSNLSILSIQNESWKTVDLDIFKKASEELKLGDLIHANDFLFETATHSLEIMNPKLDSYCSLKEPGLFTPEYLYQHNKIPKDTELDKKQIIAIVDRLLGYEVSWMSGDPIAFSLFTCLYLHFPQLLENKYLAVYINTLLATCDHTLTLVSKGEIVLEEDFNLSSSLPLLNANNMHTVVNLRELANLEADLKKSITEEKDELELKLLKSLLIRIQFRKTFYLTIYSLSSNISLSLKTINELIPILNEYKKDYNLEYLELIPKGIFDSSLMNLMSSINTQPPKERSFQSSTAFFEKLFSDFILLFKTPYILESQPSSQQQQQKTNTATAASSSNKKSISTTTTPFRVQDILEYQFYLSRLSPNIIVRSVSRRLLFPLPNNLFFKLDALELSITEWMNEFGIPYQYLKNQEVSIFIDRFSSALQKIFIYLELNRARQRRKLKNTLFDLTILQSEADIIDTNIAKDKNNITIFFGSFVFQLKLRLMAHYLYLGFELEIYSIHEYQMVYWYIDHFISIHNQVVQYVYRQNHLPAPQKKGNKKHQQQPQQDIQAPITVSSLLLSSNHLMTRSMYQIMCMLKNAGLIKTPDVKFSSPNLRYLKRFEQFFNPPFQQPEPVPLEQWESVSQMDGNVPWLVCVSTALELLSQVKMAVDIIIQSNPKLGSIPTPYQIEEAKYLLRVCMSTTLQLKKLLPNGYDQIKIENYSTIPFPTNQIFLIDPKPNYPIISFKSK